MTKSDSVKGSKIDILSLFAHGEKATKQPTALACTSLSQYAYFFQSSIFRLWSMVGEIGCRAGDPGECKSPSNSERGRAEGMVSTLQQSKAYGEKIRLRSLPPKMK